MPLLFTLFSFLFFMSDAVGQFAEARELFVFGDANNSKIQRQLEILQKKNEELKERDICIIHISKGNALYEIYKIDPNADITVLLFGKDKSLKHRSQQVVSTDELFSIIDAMPMRQAEMRRIVKDKK